jgi:hypothetical protein
LRADEKHLVWVFTAGIANQGILFQSQGKWFLTEDMFARFESFDGDLYVPVIWRDDTDDIDIITIQYLAVIFVAIRFSLTDVLVIFGPVGVTGVDIANGYDVPKIGVAASIAGSHAAHSDTTDLGSIILGVVGKRLLGPGDVWHSGRGGGHGSRFFDETTTIFLWEL